MNYESFFDPRSGCIAPLKQGPTSHNPPFSALTNNMDYDATLMSGAGPSSYNHSDFHALTYPHDILPLNETCTYPMGEHHSCRNATSKLVPSSSSTTIDFSGMFDPEFFDDYHTDFFHPDTPSSASSASEAMTPISSHGEMEFPAIASGSGVGADGDMDVRLDGQVLYGHHNTGIPLDFFDSLLAMSKPTSDDAPVDWPQLLATMCDEHPEAVQWFAEMGGFQPDFDQIQMAAPQTERDIALMQSSFSSIYPHQHSDTLSDFVSSLSNSSSYSTAASAFTPQSSDSPSIPIPLHHPRPVRPIPQIPLKDLAAIALRLGKPRGPQELSPDLSSFPLLCQPVGDAVRYQGRLFAASNANADR